MGANFWVDQSILRLPQGNVVFDDVRFDNEAEAILARGGRVFRLIRPTLGAVGGAEGHASERGVSDHLITNEIVNLGDPMLAAATILAHL